MQPLNKPLLASIALPNFLSVKENSFSSELSLSIAQFKEEHLGVPSVSAHSSPTRAPLAYNSMNRSEFSDKLSNIQITSIGNALLSIGKPKHTNNSFLDVCNPNMIQTRHSISSICCTSTEYDNELQLNIRRLSEQICGTQSTLKATTGISINDRNVNGSNRQSNIKTAVQTNNLATNSGGFSDYLFHFECSDSKKAAATFSNISTDLTMIDNENKTKLNSNIETTC